MNQMTKIRLSVFLRLENIEIGIDAPHKAGVLDYLAGKVVQDLGIARCGVLAKLLKREALGSTGVGCGVALPHSTGIAVNSGSFPKDTDGLAAPYVRLARLARSVEFEARDGVPWTSC